MNQLLAAGNGDSSGGLHFPAIESLLEWPGFLFEGNTFFELNKVGLIYIWAMVAPLVIFILAIRKSALVPRGVQTVAESSVDFVRENIVMQTMGRWHEVYAIPVIALLLYLLCEHHRSDPIHTTTSERSYGSASILGDIGLGCLQCRRNQKPRFLLIL